MSDCFATLGLPRSLTLDVSAIEEAWRSRTREERPDLPASDADTSPGLEADLSELHRARAVLSDPASRLGHWLELRGANVDFGGAIDPTLMDLFTGIQSTLEKADGVIRRQREATTTLVRAMLAKEAASAQLEVQSRMQSVGALQADCTERFPAFEAAAESGDYEDASRALHQLKFLAKWEEQCRQRLLALLEG